MASEEAKDPRAWQHPGGKLRESGASALSECELLAVLIGSGVRGRTALAIAADILTHYGSLANLAGRPLEEFLKFRGLSDVKITRLAAAFEIARRLGRR
jgi:DNA repair protein RadC